MACSGASPPDEQGGGESESETEIASDEAETSPEAGSTSASTTGTTTEGGESETSAVCAYPEGAVEPMALDEVLWPYAWPEAIHADGSELALDLEHAPCDTDPEIDWSIHELLVFISVPAW
ncbi:hypothetical protein G6O69_02415 [Pseudenhygromyxa sp. WMMC2535]|uniref:hypothetical protein n=1 Tax=Pseudenhygromyxa sp. WMMC2535 TaxID=2712867 RepID=UPI0015954B4E|nr:hypothetical protein [Pseudenhygromyxa sp. WMMC2535]NVB36668.1 hypothetical protein [Pseudenhygromyxa sp. WMMC2535]